MGCSPCSTPRSISEARMAETNGQGQKNGREVILSARGITVAFGSHVVLDKLDLDIFKGEILGFVGASGAGKSVLMRTILRLIPKQAGEIQILGQDYGRVNEDERFNLDMKLGVLFQHGALF